MNDLLEQQTSDRVATRAAQYLRMSTTNQLYSLANQRAAIARYAERHNFAVVETYVDSGRSGLTMRGRPGLTALLRDVVGNSRRFDAILVYDVSRWGRFQDSDEAAHYEFLCKSNGIPVHYCAEQFTNDMALPNMIMKALKRTMAAEYSRELSAKAYDAMKRVAQAGLCLGSFPGYGLRHMLLGQDGKPKQLLQFGEHKSFRSEKVALAPGPSEEISVVRLIYRLLLRNGMRPKAITRELARRGIMRDGQPWRYHQVREILLNPKYAGTLIWGRTASKLNDHQMRLPKREWVMVPDAFQGIVSKRTFARAQRLLHDLTLHKTDQHLLDALRRLLARNGYLSHRTIDAAPDTPSARTYRSRFGGMTQAYALVSYRSTNGLLARQRAEARRQLHRFRAELLSRLQSMFEGRILLRREPGRQPHLRLMSGMNVAVTVTRAWKRSSGLSWFIWPTPGQEKRVTLLCLANESGNGFCALYVFPGLRKTKAFRVHEGCDFLLRGKRLHNLKEFYRAAVEAERQLPASDREHTSEMLRGLDEVARFFGRSHATVHRAIRAGMPVVRQGRYVTAWPKDLLRWTGSEHCSSGLQNIQVTPLHT